MKSFVVAKAPNEAFALINSVVIHPEDIDLNFDHVQVNGGSVASVATDRSMARGHLGTSSLHRTWLKVSLNETVTCMPIKHLKSLAKIVIQVRN
jgi:hypothetical protein